VIRRYLQHLADAAYDTCRENSILLMPRMPGGKLLDLGCDDGAMTMRLAERGGVAKAYGIEITSRILLAARRGVLARKADLNGRFPFPAASMDVVHGNQVIEHMDRIDHFLSECARILKPGGFLLLGTENISSWHNIAATMFGYQPFSSSNITSRTAGLGNPWALHRGEKPHHDASWMHVTLLSYRGFLDFLGLYGFEVLQVRGAGYYPLPGWLASLDPRHAVYIHALARKG
jgi:SAM-dependent methyltransferase